MAAISPAEVARVYRRLVGGRLCGERVRDPQFRNYTMIRFDAPRASVDDLHQAARRYAELVGAGDLP